MINNRLKDNKGFTLLELTLVMAVMGILMSIAAPNYLLIKRNGYNRDAHEAANHFFMEAVGFCKTNPGNITTVYPITLNFKYYVLDADIDATGSLTDDKGVISTSALEFSHKRSATVYELSALGIITEKLI